MDWLIGLIGALAAAIPSAAALVKLFADIKKEKAKNLLLIKQGAEYSIITSKIYNYLSNLIMALNADRVYIIQPHDEMVTATYEIKKDGISSAKAIIKDLSQNEVRGFINKISKEDFVSIPDVKSAELDLRTKGLMKNIGTAQVTVVRLNASDGAWIGNVFAENATIKQGAFEKAENELREAAIGLQFILPKYSKNT